jgi:ketosteroid isomerase-like protein
LLGGKNVTSTSLSEFIARYQRAVEAFINGDPEPQKPIWSRADDAVLANPLVPFARGWDAIEGVMERTSAVVHEGKASPAEHVSSYATADLAYTFDIERATVRIGDAVAPMEVSLRVTTILRRESDGWKIMHRHADPITSARPPESLIQPT